LLLLLFCRFVGATLIQKEIKRFISRSLSKIRKGYKIDSIQRNVVELKLVYDDYKDSNPICGIGDEFNANKTCNITFTVPEDMVAPILVHYEITNFHQNHRAYYKSRDVFQLAGRVGKQTSTDAEACNPLNKLGNITLHPCGLIANTFFNDQFTLIDGKDDNQTDLIMLEDGIAWQSDLEFAFNQPDGFNASVCSQCDASCCNENDSCINGLPYVDKDGTCWRFFYPLDDTTQYLYETYPDVISPLDGVTNEHFVVWMRVATQPTFRKLYGWIDQSIYKGTNITFQIRSNWVVQRFRGSKALVISTTSIFGGKNPYLAPVFIYVGYFCFVAGMFFALKQRFRPRKLADRAYLSYKEE
jgi:LEM3 (ligand-effect modulator 3) family / CDC50 family